jgi:predicted esterase
MDAGAKRPFEYGRTHVVRPKGAHKATIVWLHGLGDNGARYATIPYSYQVLLGLMCPANDK